MSTKSGAALEQAIRARRAGGGPALVAFITAGYPSREGFAEHLLGAAREADVVEIGVPFSDPMADGTTIQRASQGALAEGVSLAWILDTLESLDPRPDAPLVLMSYLNPLLALGLDRLAERAPTAGVSGVIVPDLPLEESAPLRESLSAAGVGLVQLVTPVTPAARIGTLCAASEGFVYAVTVTGITGGDAGAGDSLATYLSAVRAASPLPVCAGFGIRSAEQVAALAPHADGVIVGSALVEALERGEDPTAFLAALRPRTEGRNG